MKKLILCMVLLMSTTVQLLSQSIKEWDNLPTLDKRFNAPPFFNIKDDLKLEEAQLIFELDQLKYYSYLQGLDTILQQLQSDIGFYNDSIENGTAPVRLDYIIHADKDYREIRFVKHVQNGDPFVKRNGTIERLKITEDTIRILMKEKMEIPEKWKGRFKHLPDVCRVQATFVLNSYSDIGHVIKQNTVLQRAIDTFISVRNTKEASGHWKHATRCTFRPYDTSTVPGRRRFIKSAPGRHTIQLYANVGTGVVRNTLTPFADVGLSLLDLYPFERKRYFFTAISASPFFFFERGGDKSFHVYDNWFVNLERGGVFDGVNALGINGKDFSYGVGYLAINKGNYFKDVTVKFFVTATLMNGITIAPELIATNTFGQIFPGVTMKIKTINTYN